MPIDPNISPHDALRVEVLSEALPFIQRFSGRRVVIKYGGAAMVDEKSPQAAGLGYAADTTKVDAKKYPKHTAEQKCANCQLFAGKPADKAGNCPLFAGKQVTASGWCSAYVKKA